MSFIECQKGPGYVKLQLNRPEKANAYDSSMLRMLASQIRLLEEEATTGALIICSSNPRYFSAGADFAELNSRQVKDGLGLLAREVFTQLASCPLPTIAAIEGAAFGGGLELALACDVRVGSITSSYAMPETALGLIPAAGGCQRLTNIVGPALTKEMVLFSRRLTGSEAYHRHLTNFLTEPGQALIRAEELATVAAAHDPLANRLAKQAINLAVGETSQNSFEAVAQALLYKIRNQG